MFLCAIEFLGNSQTFLGVLIALLVIMPYRGDGNPFHELLKTIKSDVESEIPNGFSVEVLAELKQYYAYKIVERNAKGQNHLSKKCRILLANIRFNLMMESLSFHKEGYVNKLGDIFNLKEVYLAPFYMFLYCMMVFVVDEILRAGLLAEYTTAVMVWLTFLTVLFWGLIWVMYILDVWRLIYGKGNEKLIRLSRKIPPLNKEFVFVILLIAFILIAISLVGLYHIAVGNLGLILMSCIAFWVLFKGILSFIYMYDHNGIGYRFVFKHFICLVILSLFCAWMFMRISDGSNEYPCWLIGNPIDAQAALSGLKLVTLGVVLVFGVILPFVLPIKIMLSIKSQASKNADSINNKAQDIIDSLQLELKTFVETNNLK